MSESIAQTLIPSPDVVSFIQTGGAAIEMEEYVAWIERHHPQIARVIPNLDAIDPCDLQSKVAALLACSEFSETGRGIQWAATTEQHLEVRKSGASTLLLASQNDSSNGVYLLDVFGGSGFIAQFARDVFGFRGTVVTSDPSAVMVRRTLQRGLPALWQRAQDLFMTRSDSFDAVLFAYGTHHVPVEERVLSFKEAWRVLKPGGTLIFHDFEEDTPTARWFQEVVDCYTTTGHKHPHFTPEEVRGYYTAADFDLQLISTIDDCFQFKAGTREAARAAAIEFMAGAYGLEKLERSAQAREFLWEKITQVFSVEESTRNGLSTTVIHRPALVGIGRKPKDVSIA